MNDAQIKHMVDRFLSWELPRDFFPDAGITYVRPASYPPHHPGPTGTNLFAANQADVMVRHMVEGLPANEIPEPNQEWEAKAAAHHAESVAEAGVNPFDTLTMLERWKADAEPANELGQVNFSRAMLDSATDALRMALEISRTEHLRAERAIRSLKTFQDGASVAMAMLPDKGIVADFLAGIHREAVRGQLANDEVTNEAVPSTSRGNG